MMLDYETLMAEPFHPDLAHHLIEHEQLGLVLHHPLVVSLAPVPGHCNRMYQTKMAELETCSYIQAIALYERPYRLAQVWYWYSAGILSDEELQTLLAFVWPDMEGDDSVDALMIPEVMEMFRHLGYAHDALAPDKKPSEPVRVYRGGEPNGIAWSLSVNTARWFASRWTHATGITEPVYSAIAPPEAVLAIYFGRGEQEVVCDPDLLLDVKLEA